ncbi:ATP synthase F0 subunit I [Oceanicola sp. 22II-s10i]|uniref:AtpZ/AtpI family protein n=1 Tax=Oceanicola sp. 22II-s10i TaxID=1317116 RepID=UPI000B51F0FC|nr:AtpZ/AtpI family protein [Oceanicola sp. 22II-s10i]OWU85599.1 ATP synthase F0 subunit I [Oceanicola sp. 22II-s10i]
MSESDHKTRMAQLEGRLAAARKAQEPGPRKDEHYSQANMAWRMVTELVAGLGIGASLGFGLDTLAGTAPFGIVVFTLLGFAAGVKVMLRTATEIQRSQAAEAAARDEKG